MDKHPRNLRPPQRRTRSSDRPRRTLAQLVKAEALLRAGTDDVEIRQVLESIHEFDRPEHVVRVGQCWFELGEFDVAERWFRLVDTADALHGLARVSVERGELDRAVELFLSVRRLDLSAERVDWSLSEEAFVEIAERAFEALPAEFRERLANVPILHADYPEESLVLDGWDPRILGFFSGTPLGDRSLETGGDLDHVLLFQRNIERISGSSIEAKDEIRITLLHEAGHFFGLEDEDLDALGLG